MARAHGMALGWQVTHSSDDMARHTWDWHVANPNEYGDT
tara:strand:- start:1472 stop:1588 length:117 start_codon:yes stop_codon:yes gene_type:complete